MDNEDNNKQCLEEENVPEINIIPVQLIEINNRDDEVPVSSPSPTNISGLVRNKLKYYKQTYRPAWEQMPDFKGWLRGVQGEPTRAYCTYCQKTLHAHRLSLLKHTCTIRHQKAAQMHKSRRFITLNKSIQQQSQSHMLDHSADSQSSTDTFPKVVLNDMYEAGEDETQESISAQNTEGDNTTDTVVEYADATEIEEVEHEEVEMEEREEFEDDEEEEEDDGMAAEFVDVKKNMNEVGNGKPPISTHVVDTTRGQPISGLSVSLYKLIDGRWTYINEGTTNTAGRFTQFINRTDFTPGRYKLHYDVDRYFELRKQDSIFPFIEIVFDCSHSESYHIPILLSPYGYTTYRGS